MTHFGLSLAHDPITGQFHHYEIWLRSARSAFVKHVADLVPGTGYAAANAFVAAIQGGA